jgi:hypothetical protein
VNSYAYFFYVAFIAENFNIDDINKMLEDPVCVKLAHEYMRKIPNSIFDIHNFIQTLTTIASSIDFSVGKI